MYRNHRWHTSEQAFCFMKALTMCDGPKAVKIMRALSARDAKELGRKVAPYDEDKWDLVREKYMTEILVAKFSSSQELKDYIVSDPRPFAEASPRDFLWGIGLSEDEAKAGVEWKGQNLLGTCLDRARDIIMEGESKKRKSDSEEGGSSSSSKEAKKVYTVLR